MILKKEIEKRAAANGVSRSTIDKDWVLGHFIDAIFSLEECAKDLVFKGGTCLRKCYLENYRFSEDLDFTALNPQFKLDEQLLQQIIDIVSSRTDMPLHVDKLTELKHQDNPIGYAAVVKFWGADHAKDQAPPAPQRWTTSIKIEIIQYEQMIFPVVMRPIYHDYSDRLTIATKQIPCYDLKEVLSEKIRALIQRSYTAPRDYYDIWYLSKNLENLDWKAIADAFFEKMKFKGLEFGGKHHLINPKNERAVKLAWNNSLGHQLISEELPNYELVKNDLLNLFDRII